MSDEIRGMLESLGLYMKAVNSNLGMKDAARISEAATASAELKYLQVIEKLEHDIELLKAGAPNMSVHMFGDAELTRIAREYLQVIEKLVEAGNRVFLCNDFRRLPQSIQLALAEALALAATVMKGENQ